MGPYCRSVGGSKYGQIFKDSSCKYRWCFTMGKKTGVMMPLRKRSIDAKARSGKALRFLKTDGDGMFRNMVLCMSERLRTIMTLIRRLRGTLGLFLRGPLLQWVHRAPSYFGLRQ